MTKSLGKRAVQARRRKEMARLYREGLSLRHIASIMALTYQTVHGALRREGVPMRPRGRHPV
jgi:transposase